MYRKGAVKLPRQSPAICDITGLLPEELGDKLRSCTGLLRPPDVAQEYLDELEGVPAMDPILRRSPHAMGPSWRNYGIWTSSSLDSQMMWQWVLFRSPRGRVAPVDYRP